MPSDPRLADATPVVAVAFSQYRSAVAATLEEVRGYVAAHHADADRVAQLRRELGPFAAGRIDAARLATLIADRTPVAAAALARLDRVCATLGDLLARGDELFHLEVARGDDLVAAVRGRLALVGAAFGASRAAALTRQAGDSGGAEMPTIAAFEFAQWSPAERKLAPPLIVSVSGADLNVAGLADFLDGLQKIVLLVHGDCRPAPLVRLITPGVFVLQTHRAGDLEQIARWPGSAVAAVMPLGAAQFVHDPSAGPELWQRVKLMSLPLTPMAATAWSPAQQAEELAQLQALAARPAGAAPEPGVPDAAVMDPTDRLAAWLLSQTDLGQVDGVN